MFVRGLVGIDRWPVCPHTNMEQSAKSVNWAGPWAASTLLPLTKVDTCKHEDDYEQR